MANGSPGVRQPLGLFGRGRGRPGRAATCASRPPRCLRWASSSSGARKERYALPSARSCRATATWRSMPSLWKYGPSSQCRPSQSSPSRICFVFSSFERSRSVSSMRRMNVPPCLRAHSQLNSAVRAAADVQVAGGAGCETDAHRNVESTPARRPSGARLGHALARNVVALQAQVDGPPRHAHEAGHAGDVPLVAVQEQEQLLALHVLHRRALEVGLPRLGAADLRRRGLRHRLGDDARELHQPLPVGGGRKCGSAAST